ncbi:MAG: hypothetical protein ACRCS9_11285 [Hyphomicrobium sp.]
MRILEMSFVLSRALAVAAMLGGVSVAAVAPAHAVSLKECSVKYKAAKADGSLGTTTWSEFRKAKCADGGPSAPASAAAVAPQPKIIAGPAAFPKSIATKYASEKPAKARLHTCLDQYKANKVANANGGMKWIEKGGGYYSACVKKLKA